MGPPHFGVCGVSSYATGVHVCLGNLCNSLDKILLLRDAGTAFMLLIELTVNNICSNSAYHKTLIQAGWYLTGGRVLVTGLWDPPHWR